MSNSANGASSRSFDPFVVIRPQDPPIYKRSKTVVDLIKDFVDISTFLDFLYSGNEVQYLKNKNFNVKITGDEIKRFIQQFKPEKKLETLEYLNWFIITDYRTTRNIFQAEKANIQSIPSWFSDDLSAIEKSLFLNILGFSFEFLDIQADNLIKLWVQICQSFLPVSGTLAKKHLMILTLILSKLLNLADITEPCIAYTYPQSIAPSTSVENPLNIQFILMGQVPAAYVKAEEVFNKNKISEGLFKYNETGNFVSDTQNELSRQFFVSTCPTFKVLCNCFSHTFQLSSRVLKSTVDYDMCFPPSLSEEVLADDLNKDKDASVFAVWSTIFLMLKYLNLSNFMDAELLIYFITGAKMSSDVISYFGGELNPYMFSYGPENSSFISHDEENTFPIFDSGVGLMVHIIADIVCYSATRVSNLQPEKIIKKILSTCETIENTSTSRECAFLISRLLRWMTNKNPQPKLVNFVFCNTEEFEMVERLSAESKCDVMGVVTDAKYLEDIKSHCKALGLNEIFI